VIGPLAEVKIWSMVSRLHPCLGEEVAGGISFREITGRFTGEQ